MLDSPSARTGAAQALRKAAQKASGSGKHRTAAWLIRCAEIAVSRGFDLDWPDAPVYRGAVVHVEDRVQQEADLRALTPEQLRQLVGAVNAERMRRFAEES